MACKVKKIKIVFNLPLSIHLNLTLSYRVEEALKGNKFRVFFYGTYETAVVKKDDMWAYNEKTKERYSKQKPRKGFLLGLEEIENNPDIQTREQLDSLEEQGIVPDQPIAPSAAEIQETTAKNDVIEDNDEAETLEAIEKEIASPIKETPAAATTETKLRAGKRKADEMSDTPSTTPKGIDHAPGSILKFNIMIAFNYFLGPAAKRAALAADVSTPSMETTPKSSREPERTSRSGRVIKPKKFDDEKRRPLELPC